MRFWTSQRKDFDPTSDRYKALEYSEYADDEVIIAAYNRLYQLLDTDQFVWCWGEEPQLIPPDVEKRWWVLEAPRNSILAFVDDKRWHKIIDRLAPFPNAEGNYPTQEQSQNDYRQLGDIDDCWKKLLHQERRHSIPMSALVSLPIAHSWIVNVEFPNHD